MYMIQVSSILIGVSNLTLSRPFYENLLEMRFNEFRPPFASALLGDVEFNIEEDADYRKKDWAKMYVGGRKNVSFQVEDLDDFLKKTLAFGARIVQSAEEKPWGWNEAIIADRDGNEFIIEQEI